MDSSRTSPTIIIMKPTPSQETLHELRKLQEHAMNGDVTGFAYIAITKNGTDIPNRGIVGQAKVQPDLSMGLLHRVIKELQEYD